MPRRKFDKIPVVLTSGDFVKIDNLFSYLHWDNTVYLYKCPYTQRFALIDAQNADLFRLHARAIAKGTSSVVVVKWYRTIKELVAENQAFLMSKMRAGAPYHKLLEQNAVQNGIKKHASNSDAENW